MTPTGDGGCLAEGAKVALRAIVAADLPAVSAHMFTVSITEPATDMARLTRLHAETGFWLEDSGALAIVETDAGRLLGTCQFYRAGPGIHGYEIGYVIHDPADRGKGHASEALRLFSRLLFAERPRCHRLQLIIETWNEASRRVAEAAGCAREGVLRRAGYSSEIPKDCWLYALVRDDPAAAVQR